MAGTQAQNVVVVLALFALALAPWIWSKARRRDEKDGQLPVILSPEQALARAEYAQCVGWDAADMWAYDHRPSLREPWEREARRRLAERA
jgi:hypothetical protein